MDPQPLLALLVAFATGPAAARDHLPSWNDGSMKTSTVDFVEAVTDRGRDSYVEPPAGQR